MLCPLINEKGQKIMKLKNLKKQSLAIGVAGQRIVVYGDNGTGKTLQGVEIAKKICKMVSNDPEAAPIVISFEHGTNAVYDYYPVDGTDYKEVRETLNELLTPRNREYVLKKMPVVVIDGAEKIPTIAKDYVTSKKDIETLGDLGYGKGWDLFKSYTDSPFIKFMSIAGLTLIFIFHDEEDKDTGYVYPSGTKKDNGVCRYIRDNSDYTFYLKTPILEDGSAGHSIAYCNKTFDHFGRNRYGEAATTFEVPFEADDIINYIKECGENYAKLKGVNAVEIVQKQEEETKQLSRGEMIDEINRIGKILFGCSVKERAKEIIAGYTETTSTGKIKDIDSDQSLSYLLSDLTELALQKNIEID